MQVAGGSVLLVAAGGGGCAAPNADASTMGGNDGSAGSNSDVDGGGAGTLTGGGAGGTGDLPFGGIAGASGTAGQGGAGGGGPTVDSGGGGGGGGYYGGGGGGGGLISGTDYGDDLSGGGGGGGSDYVAPGACGVTSTPGSNASNGSVTITFASGGSSSGSERTNFESIAHASSSSGCPLLVTAEALEGRPASGLSDLSGVIGFMANEPDPAVSPIVENVDQDQYMCVSGCTNIVVNVKSGQTAVQGAQVTVSVTASADSPAALAPQSDQGFVCQFPNAFSTCTQTAIAMTNQDGNAYFRYWLPGAINLDSPTSPDPAAVISASATSTCSCGMGSGSAEPLDITLQPHPYINEDRPITLQDLEGLQALIRTDTTPSQARRDADRILKLLYDSKIIALVGADGLDGLLKDAQGIAESDAVDELMRKTPKLIELDWFMTQFSVPANGLEYDTLSLSEWGREISDHLGDYLADKAQEAVEEKIPKALKKLSVVKQLLKKLHDEIDAAFVDASKEGAARVLGRSGRFGGRETDEQQAGRDDLGRVPGHDDPEAVRCLPVHEHEAVQHPVVPAADRVRRRAVHGLLRDRAACREQLRLIRITQPRQLHPRHLDPRRLPAGVARERREPLRPDLRCARRDRQPKRKRRLKLNRLRVTR